MVIFEVLGHLVAGKWKISVLGHFLTYTGKRTNFVRKQRIKLIQFCKKFLNHRNLNLQDMIEWKIQKIMA